MAWQLRDRVKGARRWLPFVHRASAHDSPNGSAPPHRAAHHGARQHSALQESARQQSARQPRARDSVECPAAGGEIAGPAAWSDNGEPMALVAYEVRQEEPSTPLVRAPMARAWMARTNRGFANRCLPLLIANQSGWFVLNRQRVLLTWSGRQHPNGVLVEYLDGAPEDPPVISHFGHGIVTWRLPYLFRTPPGYNLLARGPANLPKHGIAPLEGIVETDWSVATFTMNWQLTEARAPVFFDAGEPICMVVPQRRGELERFLPRIESLRSAPDVATAYWAWRDCRRSFLADQAKGTGGDPSAYFRWQKHYFQGTSPQGVSAPEHQVKRELREFEDERAQP